MLAATWKGNSDSVRIGREGRGVGRLSLPVLFSSSAGRIRRSYTSLIIHTALLQVYVENFHMQTAATTEEEAEVGGNIIASKLPQGICLLRLAFWTGDSALLEYCSRVHRILNFS